VYDITRAGSADVDGIASLLQANSPSRGGSLTGEFPRDKVSAMIAGGAVMVAYRDGKVVGVLFSAAKDHEAPPVVHAMLAAWPGRDDAYTYGPVCIADSERGHGLLAKLYAALQRHYPGQEAILFIRRDNAASLRAHARLGMHEVASFSMDGVDYAVFSDRHG